MERPTPFVRSRAEQVRLALAHRLHPREVILAETLAALILLLAIFFALTR
jgi:hypothetical protein